MQLKLYTRPECPLCDQAATLAIAHAVRIQAIDITEDLQLLARFRDHIPVLEHPASGDRLGWPFDAEALKAFMQDHGA